MIAGPAAEGGGRGLALRGLSKAFDGARAVDGVSFEVAAGEVVAVLGPSGGGKSTLLALIAGLLPPDAGELAWDGRSLAAVPPHRRGFGLMFQDYALFPHLSVLGNVTFGLRMAAVPGPEARRRGETLLAELGLAGFGPRDVTTLSGGEQQRVALARALAPGPRLLMLDEPLGALDRALRAQLLDSLATLLRGLGQTALYVTHDQAEAFALADRVVLLAAGRVVQVGTPRALYREPANAWVARFLGLENLLPGRARPTAGGWLADTALGPLPLAEPAEGPVTLLLRSDDVVLGGAPGTWPLAGTVAGLVFLGRLTRLSLAVGEARLSFDLPSAWPLPAPGEPLVLGLVPGRSIQVLGPGEPAPPAPGAPA